jgi:transcriptional regulator with XRE-family HTH domain
MTFEKLKISRNHLGKKQKEMADLLGISHRAWQDYEQGSRIPSGKVFKSLSKLGFNVGWFFDDDVPMLRQETTTQPPPQSFGAAGAIPDDDIGLGESVELLAKIYNSGNQVLVRAIAANLHAFSEAVDNKALALKTISMMDEMNKGMLSLKNEMDEMKEELTRMKSEGDGKTAASA